MFIVISHLMFWIFCCLELELVIGHDFITCRTMTKEISRLCLQISRRSKQKENVQKKK